MTNLPIVVIKSEGSVKAEDIITNIRKIPIETDKEVLDADTESYGYKYHLVTKYYETDVLLCPLVCPLETCPQNLINYLEAIIVYFDAKNRDFLKSIPTYAQFLESNQIELGILLCHELYDDSNLGITYKEAKQHSTVLDVIELGRQRDDDDEEDDPHDPIGYDELLQALKSFLWSNVEMDGASRILTGYVNFGADDIDLTENDDDDLIEQSLNNGEQTTGADGEKIEAELLGFEKLLNDVMQFRNCTGSMSRNERLLYAQNFAEVFDELIGAGSSDVDVEK